jgi:hypothetical protein
LLQRFHLVEGGSDKDDKSALLAKHLADLQGLAIVFTNTAEQAIKVRDACIQLALAHGIGRLLVC